MLHVSKTLNLFVIIQTIASRKIDICNGSALIKCFNKFMPDAVMHLAAESHVDRSIDTPSAFVQSNIVGTYEILEASRKYWEKARKAIKFQISSYFHR